MSQVVSFQGYKPPARFDSTPWTDARIEEGASAAGAWIVIDQKALDPVDVDPSDPQLRSFTTEEASDEPGLFYRIVFLDADENTSQPTTPIQNSVANLQFASSVEFAARLGLDLTNDEHARADTLLEQASGDIRDETGQTIDLVADDSLTRQGTTDERILLSQRPVVSVASVKLDGVAISDWYLAGNTLVRRGHVDLVDGFGDSLGLPYRGFGRESQTLEIVYTHGYDTIPERVRRIAIEMVVRVWVNPGSVIQEGTGDENVIYAPYAAPPRGLQLTDSERRALRKLFGSDVGSVWMGG